MKNPSKALLLGAVCALLIGGVALANPLEIRLTTFEDFELGLQDGSIQPVLEWNEALEGLHPGQQESFRPSQLYVLDELVDEAGNVLDPNPGLVMAWGTPEDTGEIIAAWDYVLPEDPDLTGLCITLTAFPWTGMTSISFSLRDAFGVMKGWRWPVGGVGGLPPMTATTLTIAASGGPGQAGSWGYWDGGVDLTQIVAFEFDEGGVAQGGIPLPAGLPGLVGSWNFWRNIFVHPCPPPRREHFTCYKVDELTPLPRQAVSLRDQFLEEDVVLHKARELCLPVDKNGEGMVDPEYHLVCYDVFSRQRVDLDVAVTNQLGEQELRVKGKVERLCVPSTKTVLE